MKSYVPWIFRNRMILYVLKISLWWRQQNHKIDPLRKTEYCGISSFERPQGDIIWIHGVSVGEARSSLGLIEALRAEYPKIHILLTTSTWTSMQSMEPVLPDGVMHQYLPADYYEWVARFYDYWRPILGIWLESELWPNLCYEADMRGISRVLLNGRLSKNSQCKWSFAPSLARSVIGGFRFIHAQSPRQLGFFQSLDIDHVRIGPDLKNSAQPLECDFDLLREWKIRIGKRKFWLATSTHSHEEEVICAAHQILREKYPDLLCIIVPRHPERGEKISKKLKNNGLSVQLGSADTYSQEADIYIADFLGQLGIFYRLAPFAFIGGSLVNKGGHNLREAALLSCLPISGPYLENFYTQKTYLQDFLMIVEDAISLADAVRRCLVSPKTCERKAAAAQEKAMQMSEGVIDEILSDLRILIKEKSLNEHIS